MADGIVRRINDKFYVVVDEVGASSGIDSETDSVDLASSKDPKRNADGGSEDTCNTEKSNFANAEYQHFMFSSTSNDLGDESKNNKETVNCNENNARSTDVSEADKDLTTDNSKTSDVDSESLDTINMNIDNDSNDSKEGNKMVPIIKISFQDEEVEKKYKPSFMKFLTQKIRHCSVLTNSKNSLELEIFENDSENVLDFHLDTTPGSDYKHNRVPSYGKNHEILLSDSNTVQETTFKSQMPSPICFNCDGKHYLRDCDKQKDMEKIMYNRAKYQSANKTQKSRYHLDENQRFGNVVPGELSKKLRNALDLKKDQQPLFIYRMRRLGYPPAWLEEARVSHSGVVVYDSNGQPITEEEEEGEIIPENAKDRFDISKIIEFPGFNVPLPKHMKEVIKTVASAALLSRDIQPGAELLKINSYCDYNNHEGNIHGCPPISELQSKENLIKKLEPNAVQAYKKRTLTLPKCSPQDTTSKGGKRLISPTIEEMEEKKRLLLLQLNDEDENGECKPNQNNVGEDGDCEIQSENITENSTTSKNVDLGTPVLKSCSPYSKLPSREQFSVNVSEVINFENLPNSTGKYESMSNLIHKIRDTVSRIQNEENP